MRAHLVVVPSPALDHDLGLAQAVEDLAIEQLVAEPGVEALDEAVLPGAAWGDVGGLGTHRRDPCLDRLGHELGAVVGADVARHAAQDEQIGQDAPASTTFGRSYSSTDNTTTTRRPCWATATGAAQARSINRPKPYFACFAFNVCMQILARGQSALA